MTGAEIKTFFEGIIDDTIDTDVTYNLMNLAKEEVESERPWEMLKKMDSSLSASSAAKALPSDFFLPIDTIYVGTTPYFQVPFEQQRLFANSANRWYIDLANSVYYLLGSNQSGTIYFPYIYKTTDLAAGVTPVWPARFHKRIPFRMAELYYAVDQGDKALAWNEQWGKEAELLRLMMQTWDSNLKKRAIENMSPLDEVPETDIGLL